MSIFSSANIRSMISFLKILLVVIASMIIVAMLVVYWIYLGLAQEAKASSSYRLFGGVVERAISSQFASPRSPSIPVRLENYRQAQEEVREIVSAASDLNTLGCVFDLFQELPSSNFEELVFEVSVNNNDRAMLVIFGTPLPDIEPYFDPRNADLLLAPLDNSTSISSIAGRDLRRDFLILFGESPGESFYWRGQNCVGYSYFVFEGWK